MTGTSFTSCVSIANSRASTSLSRQPCTRGVASSAKSAFVGSMIFVSTSVAVFEGDGITIAANGRGATDAQVGANAWRSSAVVRTTAVGSARAIGAALSRRRSSGAPPMQVTGGPGSTLSTSSVISSAPSTHMSAAIVDLPRPESPTNASATSSIATALVWSTRCPRRLRSSALTVPASRMGSSSVFPAGSSRITTREITRDLEFAALTDACGTRSRSASRCTSPRHRRSRRRR